MDPHQAVRVVHHRELERAEQPDSLAAALAHDYSESHCRAAAAARAGFVDELLKPAVTRERLWSALARAR